MPDTELAFAEHDHGQCRETLLDELAAAARTRGLRLTPVRVRVLELLGEAHRAMGAYEILDRLRAEGLGSQPPVVYRALDFLIGAGFVHKIERLNAAAGRGFAMRRTVLEIEGTCPACRTGGVP